VYLRAALEHACAARSLSAAGARLIHRYSNAVYLLPEEHAVARVGAGTGYRAELAHSLTDWLGRRGVAATGPLVQAPPVAVDPATVVSFWHYYPQPDAKIAPTSVHLARVLRELHDVDETPFALAAWQPLTSLSTALADPVAAGNLSGSDLGWLRERVAAVRDAVAALDWPLGHGVIHGDAWAGNLLWHTAAGPDAVVIGDWDWAGYGPREVDLIPTWHAAVRYGRGRQWAADFAEVYGYDLAAWTGYPTLLAMRDLVQLTGPLRRTGDRPEFAAALHERLTGIRLGDDHVWRAL
jgi:aminoglycoside phosphotransferase (APT) family kinase protein